MSSQQAFQLQEDQLLELLLQLKKTTPDQARAILTAQPQIAYALMAVMVNLNAVNVEVVQKTLTSFGAIPSNAAAGAAPAASAATPVPTVPSHLANQPPPRDSTPTYTSVIPPFPPHMHDQQPPRGHTPNYPPQGPSYPPQMPPHPPTGPSYAQTHSAYPPPYPQHLQPSQPQYGGPPPGPHSSGYGAPPLPSAPAAPSVAPGYQDALAAIPEDQKALIMRVISLTPEEINKMPPQERASIVQLRATLGVPT